MGKNPSLALVTYWSSILFSKARFPLSLLRYWSSILFSEAWLGRVPSLRVWGIILLFFLSSLLLMAILNLSGICLES